MNARQEVRLALMTCNHEDIVKAREALAMLDDSTRYVPGSHQHAERAVSQFLDAIRLAPK